MRDVGIDDGDVLLLGRTATPLHGHVVVAVVDSELVCRRMFMQGSVVKLQAACFAGSTDSAATDIVAIEGTPIEVWGVVTTVIKLLVG